MRKYARPMLQRIEHDDVLELRLDHPPANALHPELLPLLAAAIREAPRQGARALFLSGREGMFSAGLDVPAFLALDRAGVRRAWQDLHAVMQALATSAVPTAAALTGHAPAGGCVVALFCEWRVMAAGKYQIGLNEVALGVRIPETIFAGARHVLGARGAERICCGAEIMGVEEAHRIGLVDEVVAVEDVVPTTLTWCRRMAAMPPGALRGTRALARRELAAPFVDMRESDLEQFLDEWHAPETQTQLRALAARLGRG